jgi:hypothetical protein
MVKEALAPLFIQLLSKNQKENTQIHLYFCLPRISSIIQCAIITLVIFICHFVFKSKKKIIILCKNKRG